LINGEDKRSVALTKSENMFTSLLYILDAPTCVKQQPIELMQATCLICGYSSMGIENKGCGSFVYLL